jgi:Spy/CpxP family protein refolding chaperone
MNILTNRMTRTALATLLLAVMGTALAAEPSDGPERKAKHHQRSAQQMPVVEKMMRAVRHLDLSEEQKANIKTIMHDLKANERTLMKQVKSGHEQLKGLIKAEVYDEPAVAALAEKEGALMTERLIIASRAMSKVYGQLTDDQRAELETMASERAAKRAENREQRRERKAETAG